MEKLDGELAQRQVGQSLGSDNGNLITLTRHLQTRCYARRSSIISSERG